MKLWIPMAILLLAVTGLCIWDGVHTNSVLNKMQTETEYIYTLVSTEDLNNLSLEAAVEDLNDYWTKKMDILSISISRKDMQPISDYLQYLASAIINNNQEEAITYSRLLSYNVLGLKESSQLSSLNLL